jgi:hypothetical protein
MIKSACLTLVTIAVSTTLMACSGGDGGGSGGHTSSTSSTSSHDAGSGSCSDATEPNDTYNFPAFFNDASMGVELCDRTGVSMTASLQDASDVDWFRGYSQMQSGCTPAPTAVLSAAAAAELCFVLQDDDAGPVVKSCPAGTTMMADASHGYTGCCAAAGASVTITLTDISNLDTTSTNTQFAVRVSGSAAACNDYTVTVHF